MKQQQIWRFQYTSNQYSIDSLFKSVEKPSVDFCIAYYNIDFKPYVKSARYSVELAEIEDLDEYRKNQIERRARWENK